MSDHDQPHPPSTGPEIGAASEQASSQEGPSVVSRRWLLLKAGVALNGLVGLALAVPIVRYRRAPGRKRGFFGLGRQLDRRAIRRLQRRGALRRQQRQHCRAVGRR